MKPLYQQVTIHRDFTPFPTNKQLTPNAQAPATATAAGAKSNGTETGISEGEKGWGCEDSVVCHQASSTYLQIELLRFCASVSCELG